MEDKKTPRVLRKLDTSQRRTHFNEKLLLCSREEAETRLEICKNCSGLKDWGCEITGYFMPRHVRLKASSCPYGKWAPEYGSK